MLDMRAMKGFLGAIHLLLVACGVTLADQMPCDGALVETEHGGYTEIRCIKESDGRFAERYFILKYPSGKTAVLQERLNESCIAVKPYFETGMKNEEGVQCGNEKMPGWRIWDEGGQLISEQ